MTAIDAKAPEFDKYSLADSDAARQVFNRRMLQSDAGELLPYLRQGMRVADLGCGSGSLTLEIAKLVAPGEVIGIDLGEKAVAEARAHASEQATNNVRFEVGSVYESGLESAGFDLVFFKAVLMHLEKPEVALQEAARLLVPGGLLCAIESVKEADWFSGDHSDAMRAFMNLMVEDLVERGSDPNIGRRLADMLPAELYSLITVQPLYSHALSQRGRAGQVALDMIEKRTGPLARMLASGRMSEQQLEDMAKGIGLWREGPNPIAAFAEVCTIARKR